MYCRKCGEENPDNAIYCRNCGEKLVEEEVVKPEIINETQNNQHTASTPSSSNAGSWFGCCCLGMIVIYILSAIFSGF